ncbi:MAG: hypothetical protein IJI53_01240 [Clostridia bacterium]|nr:hypothetical protein [Clostridia bacterium]MBR0406640.1 hypothetical protein [Clostridia bacterium]
MSEKTKCKRCLLREAFPQDYEKYVAGLLLKIPEKDKAPEGTYRQRLAVCQSCGQLQNGTCMGCGCLVELRAAYKKEKCPFRKWM